MVVHPEGRPVGRPVGHPVGRRVVPRVLQVVLPAPRSVLLGASASLRDWDAAVAFGRDTRPVIRGMDPMDPMDQHKAWISMDCFTKDVQWMSTFSLQQVQVLMKHDKTLSLKTWNIMKPKWDGSHKL